MSGLVALGPPANTHIYVCTGIQYGEVAAAPTPRE